MNVTAIDYWANFGDGQRARLLDLDDGSGLSTPNPNPKGTPEYLAWLDGYKRYTFQRGAENRASDRSAA